MSFVEQPGHVPVPTPYRDLVRQGLLVPRLGREGEALVEGEGWGEGLRQVSALPHPWLRVEWDEDSTADWPRFVAPRVVGVPASVAVRAVAAQRRFLPLNVWLRMADVMLEATCAFAAARSSEQFLISHWTGPHSLIATIDRRLVMSAGPVGYPALVPTHFERKPSLNEMWSDHKWGSPTASVRRAIEWLLDPWPPGVDGFHVSVPTSRHPQVGELGFLPAVASVAQLRDALRARWSTTPPVSEEHAAIFLLASCPEYLTAEVAAASAGEGIPPAWRAGALHVLADELLESADPRVVEAAGKPAALPVELDARVLAQGLCVLEARVPCSAPLEPIPHALNAIHFGSPVTVVLEHPGVRFAVRLEGTIAPSEVVLAPPTAQQHQALRVLLETPAPLRPPRAIPASEPPANQAGQDPDDDGESESDVRWEPVPEPRRRFRLSASEVVGGLLLLPFALLLLPCIVPVLLVGLLLPSVPPDNSDA